MTQTEQLYRDGNLLVDRVFRYEDLAAGLNETLGQFDLPMVNKGDTAKKTTRRISTTRHAAFFCSDTAWISTISDTTGT